MSLLEQAVEIKGEEDIVYVRRLVREAATNLGFSITDTTRIVTTASELARNVFKYAGKGEMSVRKVEKGDACGIELTFRDQGPGIQNLEEALREGVSTGGGLGIGLPGAKKLMDDFAVRTAPGEGTTVTVKKWRRN
jgi:serine/threonine-protein kinase RsbT